MADAVETDAVVALLVLSITSVAVSGATDAVVELDVDAVVSESVTVATSIEEGRVVVRVVVDAVLVAVKVSEPIVEDEVDAPPVTAETVLTLTLTVPLAELIDTGPPPLM